MRTKRSIHWKPRHQRGVILIVVLALLTLFQIVGITFVLVADSSSAPLQPFRAEAFALARQTLELTRMLGPDLRNSLHEDGDFSDSVVELDNLAVRVETFKSRVRSAHASEPDPEAAQSLAELCAMIEELQAKIDQLRGLIEELQRGG